MITLKHLKKAHKFINGIIRFKNEDKDRWYTIKACIRRNGGDCDDFRPGYWEILKLLGIPEIDMLFLDVTVNCWKMKGKHAVLRVTLNGKVYIFCNVFGVMPEKKYAKKTRMRIDRYFSPIDGWFTYNEDGSKFIITPANEHWLFRQYQKDMGRL
jgi:hypothetical protein